MKLIEYSKLIESEVGTLEEICMALKKIDEGDCSIDVWEIIQAAIEDLENIL